MDFSQVKVIEIPNGTVKKITVNDTVVWQSARLPGAYQECEWIASDGSQYINTNYTPTYQASIHYKTKWMKTGTSTSDNCIGGVSNASGIQVKLPNVYQGKAEVNSYYKNNFFTDVAVNTLYEFEIDGNPTTVTYRLNNYSQTYTSNQQLSFNIPINLFAINNEALGRAGWYFVGRIYYAYFEDNGELKREFIPCYRKSDNVIGMYDLVTNTFFTNSGTGTFTKGPDV